MSQSMSQELLAAAAKIQSINRGFAWRNCHGTIHYDPYDGYSERKSHESTLGGTMDGATFRSLMIDESEEVVQVAGHGMITRATSGVLMKVVPPCELACYEEVQGTDLAPFPKIGGKGFGGYWSKTERELLHITHKELRAVIKGIRMNADALRGHVVRLWEDNMAVVHIIRAKTSRSAVLMAELRDLLDLLRELGHEQAG